MTSAMATHKPRVSIIKNITAYLLLLIVSAQALAQRSDSLVYPDETHFRNMRQLTFDGDNAEAYWSYDGSHIIFSARMKKKIFPATECS
jgi:hypothetical protein